MTHLKEGDKAPEFHLQDQNHGGWSLSEFEGKPVVLYFYPKDDTPGCTKEACQFRDRFDDYKKAGAKVIGISPDTAEDHAAFTDKYDLPFILLADPEHDVCEKYGVWQEQEYKGQTYWGAKRTTFLIGPDGVIRKVYENVDPEGHAAKVLEDVRGLEKAA
ncbi:MAG: thioredoxin-dependent thiol peroxidase [Euryarchaeota archaeon]|nr:thioredoxin-dependent thiol peroxidase [Euryarchaeota archaeon]